MLNLISQIQGWIWGILLLMGLSFWLTSRSLSSAEAFPRKKDRELAAWLCIDALLVIAATAFWQPSIKGDMQQTTLKFMAISAAVLIGGMRMRTRLRFFGESSQNVRTQETQEGGAEITLKISDMQVVALRRLLSRIPSGNVLAREGDSLQDIGHMVEVLQAVQAALDSEGYGRE